MSQPLVEAGKLVGEWEKACRIRLTRATEQELIQIIAVVLARKNSEIALMAGDPMIHRCDCAKGGVR